MLSFKSVIEKKYDDSISSYKCNTCNLDKRNKAWAVYYNECTKCNVNVCSYLCFKKEIVNYKNVWKNLVNKEDFNMLYPIINLSSKKFVIKSEEEIYNMNKIEREKYNKDLTKFYDENPQRAQMLYNIQKNIDIQNNFERNIVLNNMSSSDEEQYDDY
jgi:hypothetical protein